MTTVGREALHSTKGDQKPVAIATLVFAALSTWAGLAGDGFLEADACTHYQYSLFVWQETYRLIDVWGRPVCTAIYAIPALLAERLGVHAMSLLLALAIAWLTRRLAILQGYRSPGLAYLFVLAQPLVFLHSFSELTELPFALLLTVAFLAYRERRWWELALVAGTMPLSRPEGFGFLLMAATALVLHGRRSAPWLLILPIPLLVWTYGGWALSGSHGDWYRWLPNNWPYSAESLYQPGHLLHFVWFLPAITGPFVFPALLLGIAWSLKQLREIVLEWGLFEIPHKDRCEILILAIPLMILAGHSVLYWLGKMASNGELRYLLIVAPFWALLLAKGWDLIWDRLGWRHVYAFAGLAAIATAWVNVPKIGYKTLPLVMMDDWREAATIGQWYETSGIRDRYPRLINSHPGVPYGMGISPNDPERTLPWIHQTLREAKPGGLLVWDPIYGVHNADAARSIKSEDILKAGWIPIAGPDGVGLSWAQWRFFASPRDVHGNPTRLPPDPADLSPRAIP